MNEDQMTQKHLETLRRLVQEYYKDAEKCLKRRGYFDSEKYEVLSDLVETSSDPLHMKVGGMTIGMDYAYYHLAGRVLEWLDKPILLTFEEAKVQFAEWEKQGIEEKNKKKGKEAVPT